MSKHRALEIGYYVTANKKRYFYVTKQSHKGGEFNPNDRDSTVQYNTNRGKVFMRQQERNRVLIQSGLLEAHYIDPGDWVEDDIRVILGSRNSDIMQLGEDKFQKVANTILEYNRAYNKNSGLTQDDFCIQYVTRAALLRKMNPLWELDNV